MISISITPELESRLTEEAALRGVAPDQYAAEALREFLDQAARARAPQAQPPQDKSSCLSSVEAQLLRQINVGLGEADWNRYHVLVESRRAETLSEDQHAELIQLSDEIERLNVQRLGHLVDLAKLRNVSLETLMDELGIKAPPYV